MHRFLNLFYTYHCGVKACSHRAERHWVRNDTDTIFIFETKTCTLHLHAPLSKRYLRGSKTRHILPIRLLHERKNEFPLSESTSKSFTTFYAPKYGYSSSSTFAPPTIRVSICAETCPASRTFKKTRKRPETPLKLGLRVTITCMLSVISIKKYSFYKHTMMRLLRMSVIR